MPLDLIIQLTVLALIDATSIGTLLIPLWLLLSSGAQRRRGTLLVYLAVLGTFYLGVGLLVLGGAAALLDPLIASDVKWIEHPAPRWVAAICGAAMLIWALVQKPADKKPPVNAGGAAGSAQTGRETEPAGARTPKGEATWTRRIGTALRSPFGVVPLALLAGVLELPTMLPYLGAIGLLTAAPISTATSALALCVYVLVMLLPALLLAVLARLAGHRLDALLRRITAFIARTSGEALWWVVGIIGFLVMRWGLGFLFPEAPWNPFK